MELLENFRRLGLSDDAIKALHKKGFEEPTPIQDKVIPLLLAGERDIIGQAQTGTGKTAAFGLPIIEKMDARAKEVKALILTPTRELAIQVAEELASLKGKKNLKITPIYGGQSMEMQMRHLEKGVHIVVGTPGRVLDHLRRKTLKLHHLSFCILDEADEMLNMGFLEDVKTILEHTNPDKRNLMFSATMPAEILNIAKEHMGPYEFVKVKDQPLTVPKTDQIYFQISESDKFEALCRIIDMVEEFYGLVFCRTKNDADRIAHRLIDRGYDAEALHGDLVQAQREKVMDKFKGHHLNILVATDVAARGIDVNNLTHVINYALPQDPEAYVHRIGRTGRAGKEGTAITFITAEEERKLLFIERLTKSKIRRETVPRVKDIIHAKVKRIKTDLNNIIQTDSYQDHLSLARELLADHDADKVLASIIEYTFAEELNPKNYGDIRDVQTPLAGRTRLFIARGKKDGMTPQKLVSFINQNVSVQPQKIQDILIHEDFSFINVPFKEAQIILGHFKKNQKGKKLLVSKAFPKP